MLSLLVLAIVMQTTAATPAPDQSAQDTTGATGTAVVDQATETQEQAKPNVTGKLRVEPVLVSEQRMLYFETPRMNLNQQKSQIRLRLRLAGERVLQLVRTGPIIITEAVDVDGTSLFTNEYTPEQLEFSRPLAMPKAALERDGHLMTTSFDAPARTSKTLKKLSATVRLSFAENVEKIVIPNPQNYIGKIIEHPRLKELGIELKVLEPGFVPGTNDSRQFLTILPVKNGDLFYKAEFFDAWLRPIRAQYPQTRETQDGKQALVFNSSGSTFSPDMQMTLHVYPDMKTEVFPFEIKDLKLP